MVFKIDLFEIDDSEEICNAFLMEDVIFYLILFWVTAILCGWRFCVLSEMKKVSNGRLRQNSYRFATRSKYSPTCICVGGEEHSARKSFDEIVLSKLKSVQGRTHDIYGTMN
jgi:hypothetical protein